ncbi:TRAP transporter small permease [Rhodobacteraceae bacterium RKSG542]|uniref:TRAP transporter small permease n=1 Tax=Pseudovibrio flavus TaxID=2529854 RepID=UPI0012BC4E86|nr:TRAP transporter small permease [Pseudovibrio flavus]MTI15925.1 TRAP transporter small permease [Pseudovibrio flavus]
MKTSSFTPVGQGDQAPLLAILGRISLGFAGIGGAGILAASCVVTLSVLMRTSGIGGIRGDFELVELICAASASLFLPLCQLKRGHVMVDIFTSWMGPRPLRRIDGLWMIAFAAAWGVLCWRLSLGLHELRDYGDRTMLLSVPIWWVFVPAVLSTGLSAIISLVKGSSLLFESSDQGARKWNL